MVQAIRFHKTGGPEVLCWERGEVGAPGLGQARVGQDADADDDEVGGKLGSVRQHGAGNPDLAGQAGKRGALEDADAVACVQAAEEIRRLGRRDALA